MLGVYSAHIHTCARCTTVRHAGPTPRKRARARKTKTERAPSRRVAFKLSRASEEKRRSGAWCAEYVEARVRTSYSAVSGLVWIYINWAPGEVGIYMYIRPRWLIGGRCDARICAAARKCVWFRAKVERISGWRSCWEFHKVDGVFFFFLILWR